jgi:osmotically-inducible protein OsmY
MKTDFMIRQDVMDELAFDPSVGAENIGVIVQEGIVTLTGFVPSYAEKYAAEKAAFRVAGVRAVVEKIEVRLADNRQRIDADIARAAAHVLEWNVLVPSGVRVTVENGHVRLLGSVKWEFQRSAASSAIRNLPGVRSVLNSIEVRQWPKAQDIKGRIEKALAHATTETANNIQVKFEKGKVPTLSDSIDAKRAALAVKQRAEEHL